MITIGRIVKNERVKKKLSQRELAKGICSFQLIDKLEKDECGMDKLMFELLVQRLGRCSDHLEYVLSMEEYQRIEARNRIETAILQGKREIAQELLEEYHAQADHKNHVQEMYYHRTRAYLLIRCQRSAEDLQEALECIQNALAETIPEWQDMCWDKKLLSEWEVENILAYSKILYLLGGQENLDRSRDHLETCYQMIEEKQADREIQSRLLPKCVYLMTLSYGEDFDQAVLLDRCCHAIELLRDYGVLYLLQPLLLQSIRIANAVGCQEPIEKWTMYQEAISQLYAEYAPDMPQDSIFFHWYQCEYHLDHELIKGERLMQNLTQEELIEDVFSTAVSLSNLENGKSSPSKKKYDALMKNLGIEKGKYSGVAVTESFEDLDWIQELRRKQGCGDFQEVLRMIGEKEAEDDQFVENNRRVLLAYKIISYFHLDKDRAKSLKDDLLVQIEQTYPLSKEAYYRKPFFVELDMIIIYLVVEGEDNIMYMMDIFRKLLDVYKNSRMDPKYCFRSYASIITNYVSNEGRSNRFHDVLEKFKEGIEYCISCGKGSGLGPLFWGLATSEKMKNPRNKELFRGAYIFAEMFNNHLAEIMYQAYLRLETP